MKLIIQDTSLLTYSGSHFGLLFDFLTARRNDDLYQEGGLRIELKHLNKHIPGRGKIIRSKEGLFGVRPSSKQEERVLRFRSQGLRKDQVTDSESQAYFFFQKATRKN